MQGTLISIKFDMISLNNIIHIHIHIHTYIYIHTYIHIYIYVDSVGEYDIFNIAEGRTDMCRR